MEQCLFSLGDRIIVGLDHELGILFSFKETLHSSMDNVFGWAVVGLALTHGEMSDPIAHILRDFVLL
jgi:hypothetical protein